MRPRPSSRGEPRRRAAGRRPHRSFNAATAFKPWRTCRAPCQCRRRESLQCGHGLQAVENVATGRWCSTRISSLQCGHGLQSVENQHGGAGLGQPGRLQCGHGLQAVENVAFRPPFPRRSGLASMRPRPSSRGEPLGRGRRGGVVQLRFNAATAFKPWRTPPSGTRSSPYCSLQCGHGLQAVENCSRRFGPTPCSRRFNAATAFKPWRTPAFLAEERRALGASMRPRPSSRGERREQDQHPGRAGRASMRPRPSSRGEPPGGKDREPTTQASMRPRPSSRGEPDYEPLPWVAPATLQCGHGLQAVENGPSSSASKSWWGCFNAATAFKPWRTTPGYWVRRPGWWLQCGHGLQAVENSLSPTTGTIQSAGFNAATAFKPWRTYLVKVARIDVDELQCGHGLQAVENVLYPVFPGTGGPRFNAATAFKPWRTDAPLAVLALDCLLASMRPRPSSRGERKVALGIALVPGASMRPRPSSRGEPGRPAGRARPGPAASMRPRPSSRGERHGASRTRRCPDSFNAATAFKPWRTKRARRRRRWSSSFNAATAFKPWRT